MRSGEAAEFRIRAVSAVVLMPVALVPAWVGGWPLAALLGLAGWRIGHEWSRMTGRSGAAAARLSLAAAGAGVAVYAVGGPLAGVAAAGAGALAAALAVRESRGSVLWEGLGIVGLAVPLVLIWELRALGEEGQRLLLWCLLVVWSTDTFAYLCGRILRGPRLVPAISPGKTWSGLLGGLAAAVVAGAAAASGLGFSPVLSMAAAAGVGLAAVAGDLAMSWAKRVHGRKDAGRIIPGHGGVLDRVDGLLLGVAVTAVWKLVVERI